MSESLSLSTQPSSFTVCLPIYYVTVPLPGFNMGVFAELNLPRLFRVCAR